MPDTSDKLARTVGEGRLVTRQRGRRSLQPSAKAPAPDAPGSLDWTARQVYGSSEALEGLMETLARGGNEFWRRFLLQLKQWELDYSRGKLPDPPTLNQVAYGLKLSTVALMERLTADTTALYSQIGKQKAALASLSALDSTIMASRDLEKGFKDRELLLKLGGTLQDDRGPLVAIQNNQTTNLVAAQPVLSQFSEQAAELDAKLRLEARRPHADIVEGEICEPA